MFQGLLSLVVSALIILAVGILKNRNKIGDSATCVLFTLATGYGVLIGTYNSETNSFNFQSAKITISGSSAEIKMMEESIDLAETKVQLLPPETMSPEEKRQAIETFKSLKSSIDSSTTPQAFINQIKMERLEKSRRLQAIFNSESNKNLLNKEQQNQVKLLKADLKALEQIQQEYQNYNFLSPNPP